MGRHILVVSLLVAMTALTAACTTTYRRDRHHDFHSPDSNAAAEHEGYRDGVRDATR